MPMLFYLPQIIFGGLMAPYTQPQSRKASEKDADSAERPAAS